MTTKTLAQAIAHCKEVADKDAIEQCEFDAIDDLVQTPCASDAEFIEKLRFLLAWTKNAGAATHGTDIARAVAEHLEEGT
jgi:hypothetical protein